MTIRWPIALLLLLPLLAEAQTIGHALFVGINSSSTYGVGTAGPWHLLWSGSVEYGKFGGNAGKYRWGGSAEYRSEFPISRALSLGLALEYAHTSSLLYHECDCFHLANRNTYRNTITIDNVSLPLSLKLRMGKDVDGYSYLMSGFGADVIIRAHRKVEQGVMTTGDEFIQRLVEEDTFDLRSANGTALGSHFRIAAGRRIPFKEGLAMVLELGFRSDLNWWNYPTWTVQGTTREYPFKRVWGYLNLGVAL